MKNFIIIFGDNLTIYDRQRQKIPWNDKGALF
jgi:hypothetical protein